MTATATVVAWHAALAAKDVERLVALSAADVELGGPKGTARGVDALRAWAAMAGATMVPVRIALHDEDVAVVEQDAAWPGAAAPMRIATSFRVRDGRVARVMRYDDLASLRAAEGTAPAWPAWLRAPRVVLRAPMADDAPRMFAAYAADPEVTRYLTWRPHASVDDTRAHVERTQAEWRAGGPNLAWVIEDDAGALVGSIGVMGGGFKVSVGYVLARARWGQGLMTEALRAVIDAAWTMPDVQRVWAICDVDNPGSARVMEKAGMTQEGVLRRFSLHPNVDAVPRDARCFAVVR